MLDRMNLSLIGLTDSYKVTHAKQYPPNTQSVYSYWESRGGEFEETVFFGLYYLLQEYLSRPIEPEDIPYFEKRFAAHFGDTTLFNKGDWEIILHEYDGFLPVEIRAVPEGTVVPTRNVLLTIENTDPRLPWVTNYVETLLCHLWYPCTVATLSREARKVINRYGALTGAVPGLFPFKLHDFGFRGATGVQAAALGGGAHLLSFSGTDTLVALEFMSAYYGAGMAGHSIPAAEHSTITAWGPDNEAEAFRNMVEQFGECGSGLYAVVSDSYDIYRAVREIWGEQLIEEVKAASNLLVVRPDSGDVLSTVADVLRGLEEKFGFTKNDAGYRVLNHVRVIQGDGMNLDMIKSVCEVMYQLGWSIDNIAFGMGAGLLQNVNRDTSQYAFKASSVVVAGVERDVWKNPVGDAGKASKPGRLALVQSFGSQYETVRRDETEAIYDRLQTVFKDGRYLGTEPNLQDIRSLIGVWG